MSGKLELINQRVAAVVREGWTLSQKNIKIKNQDIMVMGMCEP